MFFDKMTYITRTDLGPADGSLLIVRSFVFCKRKIMLPYIQVTSRRRRATCAR